MSMVWVAISSSALSSSRGEGHVPVLRELEPLHHVVALDLLALLRADVLLLEARPALRVQQVERDRRRRLGRGVEAYRDGDEPEGDRPGGDRARSHAAVIRTSARPGPVPDRLERYRAEARSRADARAVRRGPRAGTAARAAPLRRAEARGAAAPLGLPPRARGHPAELGGAEGPVVRPGRQADGRRGGGSPDRVRGLRGDDPRRELRRRRGHRLGPRHLAAPRGPLRRARAGQARLRALRLQAPRRVDARADAARRRAASRSGCS